jgi:hypothetical protein
VDAVYPRLVPAQRGFLVLWTERKADGASVLKTAVLDPRQRSTR